MDAPKIQKNKDHVRKKKDVKMNASSRVQKKNSRVKKPLNAYFVWCKQFRKQIREQNPTITIIEANALLGKIWSEMTAEQKKPYFKEAELIKKQHRLDYPDFEFKSKPRVKKPNMFHAYPYQQHVVYYIQTVPSKVRMPQEYFHESTFFEVTNKAVTQENSPRVVGTDESIRSTFSEVLSETRENLSNENSVCVQLPETELQKELSVFNNQHLYKRQTKYNPVIMTAGQDNDREMIEFSSTHSKSEGISETLPHAPEENGVYFDPECYGQECNNSKSQSFTTLPFSQAKNKIMENVQFLDDDSPINTPICDANIFFGVENDKNMFSEETLEEAQHVTFVEDGIINATPNNEEHINQCTEMFPNSKSDILNDDDFESLNCLEDLVTTFCLGEDFPSTMFWNEEDINLEDFAELL